MTQAFQSKALALVLGGLILISSGAVSAETTVTGQQQEPSAVPARIQLAQQTQKKQQKKQHKMQPQQKMQQQQQMQPQQKMQPPFRVHKPVRVPAARTRHFGNVVVLRPYGHWYHGYGRYHQDHDAYRWLAFTAITLVLLDHLSESQQRAHESAQIQATTAPIGQTIIWNEGGATGNVVATRDGTDSAGNYCREFQKTVTVGGRTEQAYGTACQKPDGAWQMVQ